MSMFKNYFYDFLVQQLIYYYLQKGATVDTGDLITSNQKDMVDNWLQVNQTIVTNLRMPKQEDHYSATLRGYKWLHRYDVWQDI